MTRETQHNGSGQQLSQQVHAGIEGVRTELSDLDLRARALVRERPLVALLSAIGVGYVVARIFSRL